MRAILKAIYEWFHKKPSEQPTMTENIDQAILDLREGNQAMVRNINRLEQADVLRSLVISMNSSRNR